MMTCKKHIRTDFSSIRGVCATCLRQRLYAYLASKAYLASQAKAEAETVSVSRSVSPPKPSDVAPHQVLFYTPPQVITLDSITVDVVTKKDSEEPAARKVKAKPKPKPSFFSMIMDFFRSMKPKKANKKKEVRVVARGMSPDVENFSPKGMKQTPRKMPAGGARRNGAHTMNASRFCFSPLVRASPKVRCGAGQAEAAFCKNGSRKLADFGKNKNY